MLVAHKVLDALSFLDTTPSPVATLSLASIYLVNPPLTVQLFEYGMIRYSTPQKVLWTAPELVDDPVKNDKSAANVFSFGILLWCLLAQHTPYMYGEKGNLYEM